MRFLAKVVSPSAAMITHRERRNRAIFDYVFSLGFPTFIMAAHIIYQPNRFLISNGLGCASTFVLTWPTYILWIIWPPILALVGALFSGYVIFRLFRHRRDFRKIVASSNSALNTSRFIRLGLLSASFFFFTLPLSIITFVQVQQTSISGGYVNYSWHFIHEFFSEITYDPFPTKSALEDWVPIIAGLLVIIFFGFAGESFTYYGKLARLLGGGRLIDYFNRHSGTEISTSQAQVTQISLKSNAWTANKDGATKTLDEGVDDVQFDAPAEPPQSYRGPFGSFPGGQIHAWQGGSPASGVRVTREEQVV